MLGLPAVPTAALAAAGLAAVVAWVLVKRPEVPVAFVTLLGALLLATTPVQPWYAVPLVALAVVAVRPEWTLVAAAAYPYFFAVILDAPHTVAIGRLSYGLALVAVVAAASRGAPSAGIGGLMPDVVIPVLNEAGALPDLLAAMPDGFTAIVVDNGSDDGSADVARAGGRGWSTSPAAASAPPAGPACWPPTRADGVVCFMDGDGSFDPADLRRSQHPSSTAGPTWCSAPGRPPAEARGRSTPAWPTGSSWWRSAGGRACVSATSARCAPPGGNRSSPWASRTAGSVGRWRWSCGRRPPAGGSTRSPSRTRPASGSRR